MLMRMRLSSVLVWIKMAASLEKKSENVELKNCKMKSSGGVADEDFRRDKKNSERRGNLCDNGVEIYDSTESNGVDNPDEDNIDVGVGYTISKGTEGEYGVQGANKRYVALGEVHCNTCGIEGLQEGTIIELGR